MNTSRVTGLSVLFLVLAIAALNLVKFGWEVAALYVAGCGGAYLLGFYLPQRRNEP